MARLGATLHAIRRHWRLSIREVEQRSLRIAQQRGDLSYQISAGWLSRVENDEDELTINQLIALAEIYSFPTGRLIRSIDSENAQPGTQDQLPGPDETTLLTDGPPDSQAIGLRPDAPLPDPLPDETTLLTVENRPSGAPYLWAIIGKLDRTLGAMVPPGSVVQIDTRKREILSKEDWTHELQRRIYFLKTKDAYICGWCELDEDSQWLTLIPHPQSPASSRRWRFGTEVENLGRVVSIVIRPGQRT